MQDGKLIVDCKQLLTTILSEASPDHELILCVVVRSDKAQVVRSPQQSIYPTFYCYEIDRTRMYLMISGVISNIPIPRQDQKVTLMSTHTQVLYEQVVNQAKNWAIDQKIWHLATAPRIDNNTQFRSAEHILVFKSKAIEWLDKTSNGIKFPVGADYLYENRVLYLRLQDSSPDVLDLSKADIVRPVFEAFLNLFKSTGKEFFTVEEVKKAYKDITKKEVLRNQLSKWKSDIMGKMINPKPILKNRIIWEWNQDEDKWRFKILSLSET